MTETTDTVLNIEHVNYPHFPGYLHDCPACEAQCYCTPGAVECIFSGEHNDTEISEEHVFLVAFQVTGVTREHAEHRLMRELPFPNEGAIVCWWVAEDDRQDNSDNDSAVFVPKGKQSYAAEKCRNFL